MDLWLSFLTLNFWGQMFEPFEDFSKVKKCPLFFLERIGVWIWASGTLAASNSRKVGRSPDFDIPGRGTALQPLPWRGHKPRGCLDQNPGQKIQSAATCASLGSAGVSYLQPTPLGNEEGRNLNTATPWSGAARMHSLRASQMAPHARCTRCHNYITPRPVKSTCRTCACFSCH